MSEVHGSFEGEKKVSEQMPISQRMQEMEAVMKGLFRDDYEGNDYLEAEQFNESEEKPEQEKVDLTERYEPDSKFEIGANTYETDDNGYIYKINGYELRADCEFTVGGATYKTDGQGRVISCDGKAVSTPEGERDTKAQTMAGGFDRMEGDQGGHILARIFGGAKGIENIIAMRGTAINESVYKRMENAIGKALEAGGQVDFHADIAYDGDSKRPSIFIIAYTVDGRETVVSFDNDEGSTDLLGVLEDKIDEQGYDDLKQEIQDAEDDGAEMSVVSVKEEYDKDGNVTKISVTIRDESADHPVNEDRVYIIKENS